MAKPGDVKTFRIVSMNGGMNTVAEDNNLISLDPNSKLGSAFVQARTEFREITNWRPVNRGGQSKTHGFTLYYTAGSTDKINGLYRFTKSDGTNQLAFSQGKVVTILDTSLATVGTVTLLTSTGLGYMSFETALDKMVCCDGIGEPRVWDGTGSFLLGVIGELPTVAGFKQTLYTQNRLFGFSGTHDSSLLYYSDVGDIANGYSANFVQCDVNDGERITCIGEFFIPGELTPVIVVGKERSVGIVTGDGTTGNPYTYIKISHDVGIPNTRQYIQYGENAAFLTPRGIQSYLTAVKNVNLQQAMLTDKVYDQFNSISLNALQSAFSWYDWKNRRLGFAVQTTTATVPNVIWYYDTIDNSMYRQNGFNLTAGFIDSDGVFYHGDETGKIYKHDTATYSYAGSAINARLTTGYMDFFEQDMYKQIEYAKISLRGNGTYTVGINTKRNYGAQNGSAHTINLETGLTTWGGSTWGGSTWDASNIQEEKFFPKGIFKNIRFDIQANGVSQPVDLFELIIKVRYLNLSF